MDDMQDVTSLLEQEYEENMAGTQREKELLEEYSKKEKKVLVKMTARLAGFYL